MGVIHPAWAVLLVALATWDGWRWYLGRIAAAPEEVAAMVLTCGFIAASASLRGRVMPYRQQIPLTAIAVVLSIYAATYAFLPAILRAAIALSVTLYCVFVVATGKRPPLAFWGLIGLSLPVLPSLQFTFGYPMRMVSAGLTVWLLRAQGLAVEQRGTFLIWRGDMVQFDAPCSGVNMLWAGLMLALMASITLGFGWLRTVLAAALSIVVCIAGNALRASSLFHIEAGILTGTPAWWHDAVGIAAFAISAAALLWLMTQLKPQVLQ